MTDLGLSEELEQFLVQEGIAFIACADLAPVPTEQRRHLPRGISLGVALSPEVISGITDGPTDAYAREYDRVNAILDRQGERVAAFLHDRGHQAVALSTTVAEIDKTNLTTPLPHKTVATLAGVGWIGKSALLVTEAYGPAVRCTTILTDAPLPVGQPIIKSRCGACRSCVEACPAHALSGGEWRQGLPRHDFYDAFACCEMARRQSEKLSASRNYTICGICIAACPRVKRHLSRARGEK